MAGQNLQEMSRASNTTDTQFTPEAEVVTTWWRSCQQEHWFPLQEACLGYSPPAPNRPRVLIMRVIS